jgi:hypothetical protein
MSLKFLYGLCWQRGTNLCSTVPKETRKRRIYTLLKWFLAVKSYIKHEIMKKNIWIFEQLYSINYVSETGGCFVHFFCIIIKSRIKNQFQKVKNLMR